MNFLCSQGGPTGIETGTEVMVMTGEVMMITGISGIMAGVTMIGISA